MPSLVRALHATPAAGHTVREQVLAHLAHAAPVWGVAAADLPALEVIGEIRTVGGTIARVRQTIDGLPLEDGELRVMVRPNGDLVAIKGALVSTAIARPAPSYRIDDAAAIARAISIKHNRAFDAAALTLKHRRADGSRVVRGRSAGLDVPQALARKAWHHGGRGLVPVWIVEADTSELTSTHGDTFQTVLTGGGERVVSTRTLVSDVAFNYRVFGEAGSEAHPADGPLADFVPHPTGLPDGSYPVAAAPTLVSVDGLNHPGPGLPPDPWLLSTRTETLGNNVEAYSDVNAPSGMTFGDFRATLTGTRTFDRAYDLNLHPLASQAQQMASITSLFYNINWQHDFWYDVGFTEAAGNAQDNNFGRGGEDRDAIIAETQDNYLGASLNNANMSSPSDGLQPRMQVFVWSGPEERTLTLAPSGRTPRINVTVYGPISFDFTGQVILGVDGTAPVNDGCQALTNAVAGKIVLLDRNSTCSIKRRTLNAQTAGAIGVLINNNGQTTSATAPPYLPDDVAITTPITIGTYTISTNEGTQLKADLTAGAVTATAHRLTLGPQLDGGLDGTLVAHEFGHYLHHRLQNCGTTLCSAESEGWGDFNALMLSLREGDNLDGAFPFSVYTVKNITTQPGYFGIRRVPYSVDPAINAFSFRHMSEGVALPTTHPLLAFGPNSEVHNAGEIWAQTMWEVYVALQKAGTSFTAVRTKMGQYTVGMLLMAPSHSTPTELRDTLLTLAEEPDRPVIAAAFARRGMGSCAKSPDRNSETFTGIVESTDVSGRLTAGAATYIKGESCDTDDILDGGEKGTVVIPIRNVGIEALVNVAVTVTTTAPNVTVDGTPTEIAMLPAGATQELRVGLKVDPGASGVIDGVFKLTIANENGCGVVEVPYLAPINADEAPAMSATDACDATTLWRSKEATDPLFRQVQDTGSDRMLHGDDSGSVSDTNIESPAIVVGTTAPLTVTFSHRYSFELSDNTAWDGGVIEYTEDDGASWHDVAEIPGVTPGYDAALTNLSSNPLALRQAYNGLSEGHPAFTTTTLSFGMNLAGKTIKLRFRIGTDLAVADLGWDIDDIQFQGIVGTPFPTLVEDRGECNTGTMPDSGPGGGNPLPPDEEPGCCSAAPIHGGNLALIAGVLGLVLRRRRRR